MQTFLTFYSTAQTFKNLDRVRHSKQRSEAIHILEANLGEREGYKHHPALKMWLGYEPWLASYTLMACHTYRMMYGFEGKKRYNYFKHIVDIIDRYNLTKQLGGQEGCPRPEWLRDTDFLESHRSNLIRKEPGRYVLAFGEGTPRNAPYLWPENDERGDGYILRVSKADRDRLRTGERVLPDHLEMDEEDGIIL